MFEGIFVQYEDDRINWWVHDLKGKYHFSRDVKFDEEMPGKLSSKKKMAEQIAEDTPGNITEVTDDAEDTEARPMRTG